ncbi:MAG: O-antigen polymerase [Ignavibacteriota bacterium]
MISVVTIIIFIFSLLLGKALFNRWFNHLSLYVSVWAPMILLYEMKLIRYYDLTFATWSLVFLSYLSFLLGVLTYFSAKEKIFNKETISYNNNIDWLTINNGKNLRFLAWLTSIIALAAVIQNWMVLIKMFGDVTTVLINASVVYRLRIERKIEGQIPYLFLFGYVSVFFAAMYTALKNKFSVISFFPFIPVILKEISQVSRAGIFLAMFEYLITFLLFKSYLKKRNPMLLVKSNKKLLIGVILILAFIISSASLVRISRGSVENVEGATSQLKSQEDNLFLSPTMYLYFSGHIGALNKFLQSDKEKTLFAEHTLFGLYSILSKYDIVKRPTDYNHGYFIPTWINTTTFLKELNQDYGIIGTLIIIFLLGLVITFYYFKFLENGNLYHFIILVFLYLILAFSNIVLATRLSYWYLPLVFLFVITFLLNYWIKAHSHSSSMNLD